MFNVNTSCVLSRLAAIRLVCMGPGLGANLVIFFVCFQHNLLFVMKFKQMICLVFFVKSRIRKKFFLLGFAVERFR